MSIPFSSSKTFSAGPRKAKWRPFLLPFFCFIGGIVAYVFIVPLEEQRVEEYLVDFPSSSAFLHHLRPLFLTILAFFPGLVALLYACSRVLDRYLARRVFVAYAVCLTGFGLIWLLLDLQNNYADFQDVEGKYTLLLQFYLVQLPALLALLSPFALLLSCLFVLNQLSTQRELTAIIQTGRGLMRILSPIIGIGVLVSLFLTLLNYHWTTWGETRKESLKGLAKYDTLMKAKDVLAYSKEGKRLWYIGLFPQEYNAGEALQNVEITFLGPQNRPEKRIRATRATWDKQTTQWTLRGVETLLLHEKNIPRFEEPLSQQVMTGWPETPSQLITPGLRAEQLSLPELTDWLRSSTDSKWIDLQPYRTQWHARFSQPWHNLLSVLLAAPLGIVFSRRGPLGGIATALLLSGLMLFSNELFLTMGAGGYMHPIAAAWGANALFAGIALLLLARRAQNRPIYASIQKLFGLFGGRSE